MGLINKLKNILFEEEEVEIPVIEKKEIKNTFKEPKVVIPNELPKKPVQEPMNFSFYDEESSIKSESKPMPKIEVKEEIKQPEVIEREKPRNINTFDFPDFDEEEFESSIPRRSTNIMEHKKPKPEVRNEIRNDRITAKKVETRTERTVEATTKAKFRPSPIISPVYGILDKNYTPDEITTRDSSPARALDVDIVRKKAFGEIVDKEDNIDDKILVNMNDSEDKILEEKLEKARTIDELLKDSSDEIIDINDTPEVDEDSKIDSLDDIEPIKPVKEEDSLENDLFDLIDSMYENREEEK